ncbi:MAG: hypothetical protein ABFQ62_05440 [Patescibacteria group bacterium]
MKKINIAVCGSNASGLPKSFNNKAQEVGAEIARNKATLFTGVTTGFSYEAVKGAHKNKGKIVGITGAESEDEHKERYEKVDLKFWNPIIYTGVGYKMRDIIMIRSVDAAVYIGGGVGTMVEMAAAPDSHTVMGILEDSGGATELIEFIEEISHRNKPVVVREKDPKKLVAAVIRAVKEKSNV